MNILFRVDSSLQIGTGHVIRCLTLAKALATHGIKVVFLSRDLNGNINSTIKKDFQVILLNEPECMEIQNSQCVYGDWLQVSYEEEMNESNKKIKAHLKKNGLKKFDWIIVDHYAIEKKWHLKNNQLTKYLLQIDDLADRHHFCDILLDQTFFLNCSERYNFLLKNNTVKLLGPSYALIKSEFSIKRKQITSYLERYKNGKIVIFFGGVDLGNETEKALQGIVLNDLFSELHFDVIIGQNNPHKNNIKRICSKYSNVKLNIQVPNMYDYFSEAFLYIGAVGATSWERCALGLPAISCAVADNQRDTAISQEKIGVHTYLGKSSDLTSNDYNKALNFMLNNKSLLFKQSTRSLSLVDGLGVEKVVKLIIEHKS